MEIMTKRTKIFYYLAILLTLFSSLYCLMILNLLETFYVIVTIIMVLLAASRYFFGSTLFQPKIPSEVVIDQPKISIHLAICNEPPTVVINTLKAALNIDYSNYEIIVLDNNTLDRQKWQPVKEFCKDFPEKIKFRHFDLLSGYKAGALNECIKLTDESADYILTLDADYQLKPNCLQIALNEFKGDKLAVLQFPQHYKFCQAQLGLFRELEHFFRLYASSGSKTLSTLPTGTLTFISKNALLDVGGWPEETLTEDARLGLELLRNNYRLKFSAHRIGFGIMPLSIGDLRKQRSRWSYGNAQCMSAMFDMKMDFKSRLSAFLQLLSWINLLAFPILGALLYIGLTIVNPNIEFQSLGTIILFQFGIYVMGKIFLFLKGSARERFKSDLRAYFIHLALSFEMAFACWSAFLQIPQSFIRTNKIRSRTQLSSIPVFIPVVLGALMSLFIYQGEYINAFVSFSFFILFLYSSLYMYYEFEPFYKKDQPQLKTAAK